LKYILRRYDVPEGFDPKSIDIDFIRHATVLAAPFRLRTGQFYRLSADVDADHEKRSRPRGL